jgi:HEAT repeat protein
MRHEEILVRLSSDAAADRRLALALAARYGVYRAIGPATRMLSDPDAETRASAAWTLDRLGAREALPSLLGALCDQDSRVRSNAGWALVHFAESGDESVVPAVAGILDLSDDEAVRQMARLVLQSIGGPDAQQALLQ